MPPVLRPHSPSLGHGESRQWAQPAADGLPRGEPRAVSPRLQRALSKRDPAMPKNSWVQMNEAGAQPGPVYRVASDKQSPRYYGPAGTAPPHFPNQLELLGAGAGDPPGSRAARGWSAGGVQGTRTASPGPRRSSPALGEPRSLSSTIASYYSPALFEVSLKDCADVEAMAEALANAPERAMAAALGAREPGADVDVGPTEDGAVSPQPSLSPASRRGSLPLDYYDPVLEPTCVEEAAILSRAQARSAQLAERAAAARAQSPPGPGASPPLSPGGEDLPPAPRDTAPRNASPSLETASDGRRDQAIAACAALPPAKAFSRFHVQAGDDALGLPTDEGDGVTGGPALHWLPVLVMGFDPQNRLFLIQRALPNEEAPHGAHDGASRPGALKWVRRLNLRFEAEDEHAFNQRRGEARVRRTQEAATHAARRAAEAAMHRAKLTSLPPAWQTGIGRRAGLAKGAVLLHLEQLVPTASAGAGAGAQAGIAPVPPTSPRPGGSPTRRVRPQTAAVADGAGGRARLRPGPDLRGPGIEREFMKEVSTDFTVAMRETTIAYYMRGAGQHDLLDHHHQQRAGRLPLPQAQGSAPPGAMYVAAAQRQLKGTLLLGDDKVGTMLRLVRAECDQLISFGTCGRPIRVNAPADLSSPYELQTFVEMQEAAAAAFKEALSDRWAVHIENILVAGGGHLPMFKVCSAPCRAGMGANHLLASRPCAHAVTCTTTAIGPPCTRRSIRTSFWARPASTSPNSSTCS